MGQEDPLHTDLLVKDTRAHGSQRPGYLLLCAWAVWCFHHATSASIFILFPVYSVKCAVFVLFYFGFFVCLFLLFYFLDSF